LKLIYCETCRCLRTVTTTKTTCDCGEVSANYQEDYSTMTWNGRGHVVGIPNHEFIGTLLQFKGTGGRYPRGFWGYFINPNTARTVERVPDD
jgi:hypothetical protein